MPNEPAYKSTLAKEIADFISEKHALGFKYTEEAGIMRRFDEYWSAHGYEKAGLSVDNLADWCLVGDSEGAGSFRERVSVVRQFSKYLNGIGIVSYTLPIKVKYSAPLPHLFTKSEVKELFLQIDSYKATTYAFTSRRIANEYPVLFRFIYLNGLRISEACKLAASQIDFERGIVTILDAKGNKDRLIYLSEDMKNLCTEYRRNLCKVTGSEPKWFFPGRKIDDPIGISTVDNNFNIFWGKTSFAASCSIKPTVHDLRHTYVVERINGWMEQGLNFNSMLPYLCKFLGHKTFNETYYYYHYAEDAAKTIHRMDKTIGKVIPEVMRR